MNKFPHLSESTEYPGIDNVNPYMYKNNFDYHRWDSGVTIKLCNVPWDSQYDNVVKFEDNKTRDNYLDSLAHESVTLTSPMQIMPETIVKIPIPFNTAVKYNYIIVDFVQKMTSDAIPLEYETDSRTQRYCYFMENIQSSAPSTTACVIELDQWATFINDVDINYMLLERGHAPMAATTVENYLANPMENNTNLLAPDVNYGSADITHGAHYVPANSGKKYVLIATTLSQSQFAELGNATDLGNESNVTYANTTDRWGNQYNVNGYDYKIGEKNYSSLKTPATTTASVDKMIANGTHIFAIAASDVYGTRNFFEHVKTVAPNFMLTIKSIFIATENMFSFNGDSFDFKGYKLRAVLSSTKLLSSISLKKSDFGFDSKIANIAKLYTFPYSRIEMTDLNGNTHDIRIENTSALEIHSRSSIAYPALRMDMFLVGVNGNGKNTTTWVKLDDASKSVDIWNSDFAEYMSSFNIPTYSIYVDAMTDYAMKNYHKNIEATYRNSLVEYHNAIRALNTGSENSKDSANNAYTTTAASANTGQTNANASANVGVANVSNTGKNSKANNDISYDTQREVMANSNATTIDNTVTSQSQSRALQTLDNELQRTLMEVDNQTQAVSAATNAVSNLAKNIGNPVGMIGGAIDAVATAATTVVALNANETKTTATINNANYKVSQNITSGNAVVASTNQSVSDNLDRNLDANRDMLNNSISTANQNAENTANVSKANATRSRDTTIGNAGNNRNTAVANTQYSQSAEQLNLKNNLVKNRDNMHSVYDDSQNSQATEYGTTSGDSLPDEFGTRGIQLKIKTQTKSAINQAATKFLRYGYDFNQQWDPTDLQPMKHFTYWKTVESWVNSTKNNEETNTAIRDIFNNGTTIWNNPMEIGKVNIYDNI